MFLKMTVKETLNDIASILMNDVSDESLSNFVTSLKEYVSVRNIHDVGGQFQLLLVMMAALESNDRDIEELVDYSKKLLDKKKEQLV